MVNDKCQSSKSKGMSKFKFQKTEQFSSLKRGLSDYQAIRKWIPGYRDIRLNQKIFNPKVIPEIKYDILSFGIDLTLGF